MTNSFGEAAEDLKSKSIPWAQAKIYAYDVIHKDFLDAHLAGSLKLEFFLDGKSVESFEVKARGAHQGASDSVAAIFPKLVQSIAIDTAPKESPSRLEFKLRVVAQMGTTKFEGTETIIVHKEQSVYIFIQPVADPKGGYSQPLLRFSVQNHPFEWQ